MRCARSEPVIAKGFAEPIEAYQVLGAVGDESGRSLIEVSSPALSLRLETANLADDDRAKVVRELRNALERITSGD